jgi:hypothetical protein
MLDLDEDGQRALTAESERYIRRLCDAFQLPYSDVFAEFVEDSSRPKKPPILYTYVAPEGRVVTFTTNTIRIRLPDTAGEYHAGNIDEFAITLGTGVLQFPPSVQLMLYLVANDMTPRERKTMSALLWEDEHPELSEAMFGCWTRCDAGTDKKFGTVLRGYLCSSIFDKRSTVLELARTSPCAVHFWMEMSRLAPQWRNFLPDMDVPNETYEYRYTRVLRMVIRDQDGLGGLDGLENAMSDATRFTIVHQRIDAFLPNGNHVGEVHIKQPGK